MDTPEQNGFNPQRWYLLSYLMYKLNYKDLASCRKSLEEAGARIIKVGDKDSLVQLGEGMGNGP